MRPRSRLAWAPTCHATSIVGSRSRTVTASTLAAAARFGRRIHASTRRWNGAATTASANAQVNGETNGAAIHAQSAMPTAVIAMSAPGRDWEGRRLIGHERILSGASAGPDSTAPSALKREP